MRTPPPRGAFLNEFADLPIHRPHALRFQLFDLPDARRLIPLPCPIGGFESEGAGATNNQEQSDGAGLHLTNSAVLTPPVSKERLRFATQWFSRIRFLACLHLHRLAVQTDKDLRGLLTAFVVGGFPAVVAILE